MTHQEGMRLALAAAQHARLIGEVPVGAVLVAGDRVVATGWNTRETAFDATGHAELMALRLGGQALGRWRLKGCTLYVTLEPCPMCAGAIAQSWIDRVVFGAYDPRLGAAGSVFSMIERPEYGHAVEVLGGFQEDACSGLLTAFFEARRQT